MLKDNAANPQAKDKRRQDVYKKKKKKKKKFTGIKEQYAELCLLKFIQIL